jgi:hypothetical protein
VALDGVLPYSKSMDHIGLFAKDMPQEITSDAPYCLPNDEARKEQGNKENDDTIDSNFQP